jgi:maltose alpha-D-glucosyltransferase/alpha-amylase
MKSHLPAWLDTAAFYQVYPQSFQDTNGDGIGDLPGVIARLDYIRSLGCDALWLNPFFVSPFRDAGYDVADFCQVAPRYGTNADAKRLFREAKKRGMRVVLDLVAGHTSDQHPWFKKSASPMPNACSDWYIWSGHWLEGDANMVRGATERAACYQPNFFYHQPALNYGYAQPDPTKPWQLPVTAPGPRAVREELRRIMAFWLDLGCDGFRVDMAASLVKGDPDGTGLKALWDDYRTWLAANYPEAVLVSEWGNPRASIGSGFHIDFLLHFGEPAYQHLCAPRVDPFAWPKEKRGYFDREGRGDITAFLENYLPHLADTAGRGHIALPTGNHDFARFRYGRSEAEQRVFHALLFTLPGVPFLYYGDEIGMDFNDQVSDKEGGYTRTGTRTPMQWTRGRNAGFSTAPARQIYLPLDSSPERVSVAAQDDDPASLLNHTRRLLHLRREHPALGNTGSLHIIHAAKDHPLFVFERRLGGTRYLVAINPTRHRTTVDLPALICAEPVYAEGITSKNQRFRAAPFSFGIWQLPAPETSPITRTQ